MVLCCKQHSIMSTLAHSTSLSLDSFIPVLRALAPSTLPESQPSQSAVAGLCHRHNHAMEIVWPSSNAQYTIPYNKNVIIINDRPDTYQV